MFLAYVAFRMLQRAKFNPHDMHFSNTVWLAYELYSSLYNVRWSYDDAG